ncbi:MAG: hypothetical protein M3Q87_13285, partial [Actinomycetota bacterium]|nr:hypothetical protein [Actinomycetota bacterium]
VRELHRTDGEIDRLWIVFEQHCKGYVGPAAFGEVRIGFPGQQGSTAPSLVSWPNRTFVSSRGTAVAVEFRQSTAGPVPVDGAAIVGAGRAHFEVVTDRCSDTDLAMDACVVEVAFVPESSGPHRARLRIAAAGDDPTVPLEAFAVPGRSVLDLNFESSHPLNPTYSDPSQLRFTSEDSVFFSGNPHHVSVHSFRDRFHQFEIDFAVPTGGLDTTYSFGEPGDVASLDLYGEGSCNDDHGSLRVDGLVVGPNETVRRVRVGFVHVCDDEPGADGRLVGDLTYRWAADADPPTTVTELRLRRARTGGVTGTWEPAADADLAGEVARWYPGRVRAPMRPTAGLPAQVTRSGAVQLPAGARDVPVTVAVFGYDETGNVSEPTVARLGVQN